MRSKAGMKFDCIFEETLDFIDIDYTHLNKTIRYEQRPHGKWIDHSDEGYVECPFCDHATTCDDNIEELHYCFFCGAELRKSGEEK